MIRTSTSRREYYLGLFIKHIVDQCPEARDTIHNLVELYDIVALSQDAKEYLNELMDAGNTQEMNEVFDKHFPFDSFFPPPP